MVSPNIAKNGWPVRPGRVSEPISLEGDSEEVLLVMPPPWVLDMPPASLPALTGYLRSHQVLVSQWDLNIEFFDHILSGPFLAQAHSRIKQSPDRQDDQLSDDIARSVAIGGYIADNVEDAKMVHREWDQFMDIGKLARARRILDKALEIVSHAHAPLVYEYGRIGLGNMIVDDIQGYDEWFASPCFEFITDWLAAKLDWYAGKLPPRILGISAYSEPQFVIGVLFARLFRERYPDTKILFGGAFVGGSLRRLNGLALLAGYIDGFVTTDGERPLLAAVQATREGQPLTSIPGIFFPHKVAESLIAASDQPDCLDDLPAPDFDGLPWGKYLAPCRVLPYAPTRGCLHRCAFCSYNENANRQWRCVPPDIAAKHMEELSSKFSTQYFFLCASIMPPPYLAQMCAHILQRKLDVFWAGQAKPSWKFTDELGCLMREAGCMRVDLGVESGSDEVLRRMQKHQTVKECEHTIDNLASAGIAVFVYTIYNFPGETLDELHATFDLLRLKASKVVGFSLNPFSLLVGSPVWENPEQYGLTRTRGTGAASPGCPSQAFFDPMIPPEVAEERNGEVTRFLRDQASSAEFEVCANALVLESLPRDIVQQLVYLSKCSVPWQAPEQQTPSWTGGIRLMEGCLVRTTGCATGRERVELFSPLTARHISMPEPVYTALRLASAHSLNAAELMRDLRIALGVSGDSNAPVQLLEHLWRLGLVRTDQASCDLPAKGGS